MKVSGMKREQGKQSVECRAAKQRNLSNSRNAEKRMTNEGEEIQSFLSNHFNEKTTLHHQCWDEGMRGGYEKIEGFRFPFEGTQTTFGKIVCLARLSC